MEEIRLIKIGRIRIKEFKLNFDYYYDKYKKIADEKGLLEVRFINERKFTNVYGTKIIETGDFFEQ